MQNSLFRKDTLAGLSSPDELDRLMHVTDSRGWLALVALSILVVTAIVWGFAGSIPVEVRGGNGELIHRDARHEVVSTVGGLVTAMNVRNGDTIRAGQPVARVRTDAGAETEIVSLFGGEVNEVFVQVGMIVDRGDQVANVHQDDKPMEAVVYLPVSDAKRISPGMRVHISPTTVQAEEFGFIQGKVTSIGEFPVTQRQMSLVLENEELVQLLSSEGAQVQVEVDLEPNAKTASGFRWSSPQGPPFRIDHGTLCAATFVLGEERPAAMVLPEVR